MIHSTTFLENGKGTMRSQRRDRKHFKKLTDGNIRDLEYAAGDRHKPPREFERTRGFLGRSPLEREGIGDRN